MTEYDSYNRTWDTKSDDLYVRGPHLDRNGWPQATKYRLVTDEGFHQIANKKGYVKLDVDVERLRTDLQVAELVGAKSRLGDSYMMAVARQVLAALDGAE